MNQSEVVRLVQFALERPREHQGRKGLLLGLPSGWTSNNSSHGGD